MIFNKHLELANAHAFLSPSKYHWLRYDEGTLADRFANHREAAEGTELHALAATCITKGIRLLETGATLNMYVNDAIGFHMTPEVSLAYSENAFGTADAIGFDGDILRIHDLKTGRTKPSMDQLRIYAAFFALEYEVEPEDHETILRLYYMDDIIEEVADTRYIRECMATIIHFDKLLSQWRTEV